MSQNERRKKSQSTCTRDVPKRVKSLSSTCKLKGNFVMVSGRQLRAQGTKDQLFKWMKNYLPQFWRVIRLWQKSSPSSQNLLYCLALITIEHKPWNPSFLSYFAVSKTYNVTITRGTVTNCLLLLKQLNLSFCFSWPSFSTVEVLALEESHLTKDHCEGVLIKCAPWKSSLVLWKTSKM